MKAPSAHELSRKHQPKLVTLTLRISDFGERDSAMGGESSSSIVVVQEGRLARNAVASRRRRRAASHVRDSSDELTGWVAWLAENGIAVEEERVWVSEPKRLFS